MGLTLCLVGFFASFLLGRRSLAAGLGGVFSTGYLYGILRANYLDSFAHFIFDAAVLGFYLSRIGVRLRSGTAARITPLRSWVIALLAWSGIMFLLPLQHPLIQLVGLRGNAFLLPFLLIGGQLQTDDARRLSVWLAALNLVALSFATAQFFLGVAMFFPVNAVTEIIYKSNDVADYTAYRIPATFANAHAYAGAMIGTIPWLVGGLIEPGRSAPTRVLVLAGVGAALLGVFLTATRVTLIVLFVQLVVATFSGRIRGFSWIGWLLILGGVAYVVSGEERLQRFLTLQDTDKVFDRFEGSVNLSFWDLMLRYPMGNGMGAGGTSIPYFLQHLITNPVGMENEYSRILLEQGLVGLGLWIAFICWVLTRPRPAKGDPWFLGLRLLWFTAAGSFALSVLGTGLMTAIPQSALLFLGVGFMVARRRLTVRNRTAMRGAEIRRDVTPHARRLSYA
jgi:hypothetical protein